MHLFPQASISAYPRYFFLPITRYFCRCCLWPVASLPSPLSSSETALWKPPWSLRHQLPWACLSVLPALPFLSLLQHLTLQMAPIFSRLPSSSLCRLFLFSFWVFPSQLKFWISRLLFCTLFFIFPLPGQSYPRPCFCLQLHKLCAFPRKKDCSLSWSQKHPCPAQLLG